MQQLRLLSALLGLFLFTSSAFGQNCRELHKLPKTTPVITQITEKQFKEMTPPEGLWAQMKGEYNCIDGVLFVRTLNSVEFRTIAPPGYPPSFIQCQKISMNKSTYFLLLLYPL